MTTEKSIQTQQIVIDYMSAMLPCANLVIKFAADGPPIIDRSNSKLFTSNFESFFKMLPIAKKPFEKEFSGMSFCKSVISESVISIKSVLCLRKV